MICVLHITLFLCPLSLCDAMPSFACFCTDHRSWKWPKGLRTVSLWFS